MKKLILLAVLLVSCGREPEYYTQQGVGVWENGLQLPYGWTERKIQCYIEYLPMYTPEIISESLTDVVVDWQPQPFGEPGIGLCNGSRWYYIIKAVWYPDDPDFSEAILYHELTHWILDDMTGDGDGRHLHDIWSQTDDIVGKCKN